MFTIRSGVNDDGQRIRRLLEEGGFPNIDISWDNIELSWLVAEKDGEMVGAINLSFGRPVGRIEMLCIDQTLPQRHKAKVAAYLFRKCREMLIDAGSAVVMSLISDEMKGFQELVARHGGVPIDKGALFIYLL